jgi:hypothetical protein
MHNMTTHNFSNMSEKEMLDVLRQENQSLDNAVEVFDAACKDAEPAFHRLDLIESIVEAMDPEKDIKKLEEEVDTQLNDAILGLATTEEDHQSLE